ncbi:carbon-nitrogen hydrolase family protein [Mycobacterium sp. 141]|uniref:carbon-nitrogen hydrolase family protein n=1 Tax=Mycobacterium sp. 141 TaxID=1120797 RepID=UPI0003A3CF25|nr:carbon-nitrogen hydrolase family protein [Mycobacterium sp. 141]
MSITERQYLAAAVQAAPVWLNLKATVKKAVALIDQAAGDGARLVAFPETFIPGYPAYVYGSTGWDDKHAKEVHRELMENSITVPGPELDEICEAARRNHVVVVIGVNERDAAYSGGTLYNSLVFISDEGTLLGVHRKLTPTHAEKVIWGMGDASGLRPYDTSLGKVGGLICWEHWMPLSRFTMHAMGEQVHIAAWPEVPELHQIASRHYAFEGRCFVICVGSFMTTAHIPADFPLRSAVDGAVEQFGAGDELILPGGSGIVGPDGEWITPPKAGEETIVYGEINLDRVAEEQLALDTAGHYNRPDIFRLTIDNSVRTPFSVLPPADLAVAKRVGPISGVAKVK